MGPGDKPLRPPPSSSNPPPSNPPPSSSSSYSALIQSKYRQLGSAFPSLSSSPLMESGAFSASEYAPSLSLEPKIEPFQEIFDFSVPSQSPHFSSAASSSSSQSIPEGGSSSSPGEAGGEESMAVPRPLEALHSAPIPPFLSKTYELVDDPSLDMVISWSPTGKSFVVWDAVEFGRAILPRHFKHNNFSSFVRQLNTYGFRKVDADRWEFANEEFLRGHKQLLRNINRRRSSQAQHVGTQVGSFSADGGKPVSEGELLNLRREKSALMQEVVRLQQDHRMTVQQMDALNQRMQSAEQIQEQMVSFLARVLQNPVFLAQLKQQNERRGIASPRVRRKFLKQQQPSHCESDKSTEQLPAENRLDFTEVSSPSILQGIECGVTKQLPDNLSRDMAKKLGLHSSTRELLGSPAETGVGDLGPLLLDNSNAAAFKGKNPEGSQMGVSVSGAECFVSFPEDIFSEEIVPGAVIPASGSASEYLMSFPEDISEEKMFPEAIAPSSVNFSAADIWNVDLDAGQSSLSSDQNVWDHLVHDSQELEVAAEPEALWDLDLHNLEEDFELEKGMGGDFFQESESQAGEANKDNPEKRKP